MAKGSVRKKGKKWYYRFYVEDATGRLIQKEYVGTESKSETEKLQGFEDFHSHLLRHTFTTNLIQSGASPKDVQEMLGHSDIGTTMNWYAHGTKDTKRSSVKMLDHLTG